MWWFAILVVYELGFISMSFKLGFEFLNHRVWEIGKQKHYLQTDNVIYYH